MRDDPFEMGPDEYQRLYSTAVIGGEAREFLGSELCRYLVACAKTERDKAVLKLASVSPADTRAVAAIQSAILRLEDFERWLKGAIDTGTQAYNQLKDVTIDGDGE